MAVLGDAAIDTGAAAVEPIERRPAGAAGRDQPPPRLRHEPALDGLRGLAVVAVFLFHLERLDGGFLGVDLFFVLSGFLITSLLVVEHGHRGRIDLGRFWSRRARRLLPALLGLLVGVSVLLLAFTPADQRARFRGDALATLGYVANWHRMSIDLGYWDIFEQPSPLDHTWSLAIEEQFYVVWPLAAVAVLALGTRSARRLRGRRNGHDEDAVADLDAPAPASVDAAETDPAGGNGPRTDVALSPDRSGGPDGTLVTSPSAGRADATDVRSSAPGPGRRRLLGWLALAGAAVSFGLMALTYSPVETDRAYYGTDTRIGATLLGAALALFSADRHLPARSNGSDGRRWARWVEVGGALGLGWMVWSAVTVDGLSPWYYRGGLVVFAGAAVAVIQAVTGAGARGLLGRILGWAPLRGLGIISYGVYLWHWPVKVYVTPERARLDGWVLDGARVAVTLAVALASFWLVEQPIRRGALRGRALYAVGGGALAVTLAAVLVSTSGTRSGVATDEAALGFGPVPVEGSDNPYLFYPSAIPPDALRVLMVGDSGAYFLGPMMAAEGEAAGISVASSAPYWCNVALPEGLVRGSDGEIMDRGNCQAQRRAILRDLVDEFRPDAVVYYLANASGPGDVRVDGEWSHDCEPVYDDHLTRALQEDVDLLSSGGAHVVLTTSPYTSVMTEDADERTDCRNATYRRVAASRPDRATVVDMNAYVAQQRAAGVEMFQDLVHLSPEGGRLVSHWLFPQLRALAAGPGA